MIGSRESPFRLPLIVFVRFVISPNAPPFKSPVMLPSKSVIVLNYSSVFVNSLTVSVINTDGWRGYDGLVDIGFDKHLRVNHGNNEFACGERHINGIESFWGYAKKRLVKFNGIDKKMFYLHLKETEYRFNHRNGNLYLDLLKLLRNNPL